MANPLGVPCISREACFSLAGVSCSGQPAYVASRGEELAGESRNDMGFGIKKLGLDSDLALMSALTFRESLLSLYFSSVK